MNNSSGLYKIKFAVDKNLPEKNVYYKPSQINLSKYIPASINLEEFKQFLQSDPSYLEYLSQINLKKGKEKDSVLDHIYDIKLGRTSRLKTIFFQGLYMQYKDHLRKKEDSMLEQNITYKA